MSRNTPPGMFNGHQPVQNSIVGTDVLRGLSARSFRTSRFSRAAAYSGVDWPAAVIRPAIISFTGLMVCYPAETYVCGDNRSTAYSLRVAQELPCINEYLLALLFPSTTFQPPRSGRSLVRFCLSTKGGFGRCRIRSYQLSSALTAEAGM